MARAPTKPVQYAHLRIGYNDYLLPADKAMDVAKLMQHATKCEIGYEDERSFTLGETPEVSFSLVRANQIRMPRAQSEPAPKQATILGLPAPLKRLPR